MTVGDRVMVRHHSLCAGRIGAVEFVGDNYLRVGLFPKGCREAPDDPLWRPAEVFGGPPSAVRPL